MCIWARTCILIGLCAGGTFADGVGDYTFSWWADGWRGAAEDGHKLLNFQTSRFAAAVDTTTASVVHLGVIEKPLPYTEAVAQSNAVVLQQPGSSLALSVLVGGERYSCKGPLEKTVYEPDSPVRLIECGRFLQRADILGLRFENAAGQALEAVGRLEIVAWPDRLSLILELTAKNALKDVETQAVLTTAGKPVAGKAARAQLAAGDTLQCAAVWTPGEEPALAPEAKVQVFDGDTEVPVRFDALRGEYYVDLPERNWNVAAEPNHLDRFRVVCENPGGQPAALPIVFAFDGSFTNVIGLSPMLRDEQGNPSGIPVQISKNWHRTESRPQLYEGPWFHGATLLPVGAGATWKGEFCIAYAQWGGLPAAAHAQLCLIGWGTNQLWDQVAIGSWGESICYDPDVNLNRSMIDDVRPLMVRGMQDAPWQWTVNVGGGDFLVYFDQNNKKQFLTRMRTAYASYGPNLTEAVYAGTTADGAIDAKITVSTPRCDDLNRAYHRLRYDVRKPVSFSRLAFYQMGADRYNDHQFSMLARGNAAGLTEEWQTERGGKRYLRTGLAGEGDAPWFSLHAGERNKAHPKGGWANRGLVVRAWKARLGGKDVPQPCFAVYGTDNGMPSANVELTPPPGVTQLEPGDFVEASVEWLTLPQNADDYYGPNAALRADLAANGNTWRPVFRQAKGNHLAVRALRGTLECAYPIAVHAQADGADVEVRGGLGYAPLRFSGLPRRTGWRLECVEGDATRVIDQSVHGNDFWQCDAAPDGTWSLTYNVPLDTPGDAPATRRFVLRATP